MTGVRTKIDRKSTLFEIADMAEIPPRPGHQNLFLENRVTDSEITSEISQKFSKISKNFQTTRNLVPLPGESSCEGSDQKCLRSGFGKWRFQAWDGILVSEGFSDPSEDLRSGLPRHTREHRGPRPLTRTRPEVVT